MRWGGSGGGNIEDRRGMGPAGAVGGVGAGGVILALIGYFVFGIDPSTTTSVLGGASQVQQQEGVRGAPADEAGRFVDVVSGNVDAVWTQVFAQSGQQYRPPESIVLYDRATGTGCGMGQSAMGPFYCPTDRKVYLDLTFWQDMETQLGARGEAARAYVIAHEIGHHVQNLSGAMEQSRRMGARGAESGAVRLELQADCYAGVWVHHASAVSNGQVVLEARDIEDGLRAAAAVGDDTLQRKSQGRVMPDAFTHGSSEQRMRWFRVGVQSGDPAACDTFRAARL
ncbi:KPN_02809 family neutral zinc metallopeptidase [Phenylobacterium sp.]|jgi:predicted metalloprotease|uniref:KPN_02809 family neutral zinc metallopeptidase n=1 Tax=Phenylobacterium sp. TaxID=1871053 RepID=UPI002F91D7C2